MNRTCGTKSVDNATVSKGQNTSWENPSKAYIEMCPIHPFGTKWRKQHSNNFFLPEDRRVFQIYVRDPEESTANAVGQKKSVEKITLMRSLYLEQRGDMQCMCGSCRKLPCP